MFGILVSHIINSTDRHRILILPPCHLYDERVGVMPAAKKQRPEYVKVCDVGARNSISSSGFDHSLFLCAVNLMGDVHENAPITPIPANRRGSGMIAIRMNT
jgi:hypothetical protein